MNEMEEFLTDSNIVFDYVTLCFSLHREFKFPNMKTFDFYLLIKEKIRELIKIQFGRDTKLLIKFPEVSPSIISKYDLNELNLFIPFHTDRAKKYLLIYYFDWFPHIFYSVVGNSSYFSFNTDKVTNKSIGHKWINIETEKICEKFSFDIF